MTRLQGDAQLDLYFRGLFEVLEKCALSLFSAVSLAPRPLSSFGTGRMWSANGHRAAVSREGTWRWLCRQGSACRTRLPAFLCWARASRGPLARQEPWPHCQPLPTVPDPRVPNGRSATRSPGGTLSVHCALALVTPGKGSGADGPRVRYSASSSLICLIY